MRRKVSRVMSLIHTIAHQELQGDQYVEFLENIEYEIDRELDEGWPDEDTEEE